MSFRWSPFLQRDDGPGIPPLPEGESQRQHESSYGGLQPGEGDVAKSQVSSRFAPLLFCSAQTDASQLRNNIRNHKASQQEGSRKGMLDF